MSAQPTRPPAARRLANVIEVLVDRRSAKENRK
jgi:hypothetical protein